MGRALQLAEQGRYTVSPNPMVGCVIVRDGAVIAEGWHRRAGEAHAEVDALRAQRPHPHAADCVGAFTRQRSAVGRENRTVTAAECARSTGTRMRVGEMRKSGSAKILRVSLTTFVSSSL